MEHILDSRILLGTYDLTGTVPEIMRKLVDDCCINPTRGDVEARKIPGLTLDNKAETTELPKVHFVGKGCSLLEALNELKRKYGVDFGIGSDMVFWTFPA